MLRACGLVTQLTLSETGDRKEKSCLTQDLSFCITSIFTLVNWRLNKEAYPDLIYGFCLFRIIHFIVALRLQFSDTPILISKYNFLDAYRRISHCVTSAVQTIIALGAKVYIMLVLSFGGSADPQVWCGFSEMLCNLPNEISQTTTESWRSSLVLHNQRYPCQNSWRRRWRMPKQNPWLSMYQRDLWEEVTATWMVLSRFIWASKTSFENMLPPPRLLFTFLWGR